jgi:glycosyltransferase involved in cell wall biosynthesis
MTGPLSAAVVVCAASRERERLLRACVRSLLDGVRVPDEIIVVVDHNPALEASVAGWLPPAARLMRSDSPGISASRNVGLRATGADVVAFVDDDAAVEPDWLPLVMRSFEPSDDVLAIGGAVVPEWDGGRRWLPDELLWVVGCTYAGHREDPGPIRNPIGCNMAFRRRELLTAGGFSNEFGKRGETLVTCDETEVGLRLERLYGPGRIRFVPAARVHHSIPASRIGWRKLAMRCVSEGLSKARLRRLHGGEALSAEGAYVRGLVTRAVPRLVARGLVRRDSRPLLGAAAILMSLAVTGLAYAGGCAGARR